MVYDGTARQKIGIAVECICDLPPRYMEEHHLGVIYFLIETDKGSFVDTKEITAEAVLGYMKTEGGMPKSTPTAEEVYETLFEKMLAQYNEVIFLATGVETSVSYNRALEAISYMGRNGERVRVVNSNHLSTGLGHMVIKAVEMAEAGVSSDEIIWELEELKNSVSTSFITFDIDHLYHNGHVSLRVKKMCDRFGIHPVLTLKDGRIVLKSMLLGNYEKAGMRYVRRELRNTGKIDKTRIFITHAGCSAKKVERIKEEVGKRCRPKQLLVTNASAAVSCSCGPDAFGILYVKERNACR